MKNIITIASKEFLDTLRDKRTLIMMVIIPILIFPLIFSLITKLQQNVINKEQRSSLVTGVINLDQENGLEKFLKGHEALTIVSVQDQAQLEQLIRKDSLQIGVIIEEGFTENLVNLKSAKVNVLYSETKLTIRERFSGLLNVYVSQILKDRIASQGLEESFIEPVKTEYINVASEQEVIGKLAGGFLPYLFVIFCFMGSMYPAIDLFTGEKERKTLETLLTSPVSRLEILVGKMAVVVSSGLLSAVLAIVGLFVAVRTTVGMPDIFAGMISGMLSVKFVLLLLAMLVPLTIFFAGVMVPLTIYAKTFKEAQSILSPMTFFVIFPAVIGLMPGIELTTVTALIPIVNISLATKEILAGTIQTPLLLITIVSLITYATISVLFCVRWFGKETHILR
ncbi:MAG: ABC transporter permease [Bacteroides sp.]|jgi:sodium transport system permease protein|nr:ABC transporter permease [Bacteroides sp.]